MSESLSNSGVAVDVILFTINCNWQKCQFMLLKIFFGEIVLQEEYTATAEREKTSSENMYTTIFTKV